MLLRLLIALLILAVVELAALIWLIDTTGILAALGLLILAGILGSILFKWQGFHAWNTVRADIAAGRPPAQSVIDALLIAFAGFLLFLPGIISDVLAFSLLIPPVRKALAPLVMAYFARRVQVRVNRWNTASRDSSGEVIDAEFRHVDTPNLPHNPQ